MSHYVSYKLRRLRSGDWVRLKCCRSIADFYGWTAAFESSLAAKRQLEARHRSYVSWEGKVDDSRGGTRFRISRAASTHGHEAGMTNCFRLTWGHNNMDLALLARLIQADWEWMANTKGRRISRAQWMQAAVHPGVFETHPLLLAHPAIAGLPRQAEGLAVPAVAGSFQAELLGHASLQGA